MSVRLQTCSFDPPPHFAMCQTLCTSVRDGRLEKYFLRISLIFFLGVFSALFPPLSGCLFLSGVCGCSPGLYRKYGSISRSPRLEFFSFLWPRNLSFPLSLLFILWAHDALENRFLELSAQLQATSPTPFPCSFSSSQGVPFLPSIASFRPQMLARRTRL